MNSLHSSKLKYIHDTFESISLKSVKGGVDSLELNCHFYFLILYL